MKKNHISILAVLALLALAVCGCSDPDHSLTKEELGKTTVTGSGRWRNLCLRYGEVRPGMSSQEVTKILGRPDQINPLFEPQYFKPKRIGTTYFYVKEPRPGNRRRDPNFEIRIYFDNEQRVSGTSADGVENEEEK